MGIGADGPGLYNYTRGSPITMSDPSGHEGGIWGEFDRRKAALETKQPTGEQAQSQDKAALQAKLESIDFSRHAQSVSKTFNPSQPSPADYETGALDPQFETDTQAEAIKGYAGGLATIAGKTGSFIVRSLMPGPMYRGDSIEEQEEFADAMNDAVTVNPDPRYEIAASIGMAPALGEIGPLLLEGEAAGSVEVAAAAGRVKPVAGVVDLGGSSSSGATNLNPLYTQYGGPHRAEAVANLIQRPGEEIGQVFEQGSVHLLKGGNLPGAAMDWEKIAPGAFDVMASEGRVSIAVYTSPEFSPTAMVESFQNAGFANVTIEQHGTTWFLQAVRP